MDIPCKKIRDIDRAQGLRFPIPDDVFSQARQT
jgi:hypothetical protein